MRNYLAPMTIVFVGVMIGCGDTPGVKGPPLATDGPNQVLVKVAGMV